MYCNGNLWFRVVIRSCKLICHQLKYSFLFFPFAVFVLLHGLENPNYYVHNGPFGPYYCLSRLGSAGKGYLIKFLKKNMTYDLNIVVLMEFYFEWNVSSFAYLNHFCLFSSLREMMFWDSLKGFVVYIFDTALFLSVAPISKIEMDRSAFPSGPFDIDRDGH